MAMVAGDRAEMQRQPSPCSGGQKHRFLNLILNMIRTDGLEGVQILHARNGQRVQLYYFLLNLIFFLLISFKHVEFLLSGTCLLRNGPFSLFLQNFFVRLVSISVALVLPLVIAAACYLRRVLTFSEPFHLASYQNSEVAKKSDAAS